MGEHEGADASFELEYLWGNESPAWAGPQRPDGPVILGDVHHYPEAPHTREVIRMFRTLGAGGKPVFLSEYGVGSLVNCVRLARLPEQAGSPADRKDIAKPHPVFEDLVAGGLWTGIATSRLLHSCYSTARIRRKK